MQIIRKPFRYRFDNVVFWLIGINVLVFVLMYLLRNQLYIDISRGHRIQRIELLKYYLSMIPVMVQQGWVWTFVTYMFVHGSISHIVFNMLALFIFGIHVERQMGSREFLLFYFVTGALAGVFSFIVYIMTNQPGVWLMGASGAVYSVMLVYAVFYPDSIIYIWGIIPLRAPFMVLGFTALGIVFMVTGMQRNVAHLTHLAGFGFAWLYLVIRMGINPWRRLRRR